MSGDAITTFTGTAASLASQPYDLKVMYEDSIQVSAEKTNPLYAILAKNKKKFTGSRKEFRVKFEMGGNYVAQPESGYSRKPSKRDLIPGYFTIPGYQLYTAAISIPKEENAKNGNGQFTDPGPDEVEDATKAMKRHIARQIVGPGSCVLFKLGTYTSGLTLTVDTTYSPKTNRHVRKGDTIVFWSALTGDTMRVNTPADFSTVTQIVGDTQIVVDQVPTGLATGDYCTFYENRAYTGGADAYYEADSLYKVCGTTSTYANISPGTAGNEGWKGIDKRAGGTPRDFDPTDLYDAAAIIQDSDVDPDTLWTSKEMRRPWNETMAPLVRIGLSETGTAKMNKATLSVPNYSDTGDINLSPTYYKLMTPGDFFMFPSSELGCLVEIDLKFLDKEMMVRIQRSLMKEGQLCWGGQLAVMKRWLFAVIGDYKYDLLTKPRG